MLKCFITEKEQIIVKVAEMIYSLELIYALIIDLKLN